MSNLPESFSFSPSIYHRELLKRTNPALAFGAHLHEVEPHQRRVRQKFAELLCCDPAARSAEPLQWWSLGTRRIPQGTIEKVVFRSDEYADVPAFLCLPENFTSRTVFICLQGHNAGGIHTSIAAAPGDWLTDKPVEGDRDYAIGCMQRGIAALCVEQSCFGERAELLQEQRAPGFCHDAAVQALMLGRTLMGERVCDVARAVDFLRLRPETADARIGIMGNSGGGTISIYSAALLPEIEFCMPSCSFGSYSGSKMRIYQCGCGYVPRLLQYLEMDDVAALIAPRPLVIVTGRQDPILPPASVREAFDRLKRVYAALGAEEHCHWVEGEAGHRFYAREAWPVMERELRRG